MKLSDNDVKQWPSWRMNRLLKMLEYKSKGLTDSQVAAKDDMPSVATIARELNSAQAREIGRKMLDRATGMIWPLIEKQIRQIETDDLKPGARISHRGNLIGSLFKLVPQRVVTESKLEVAGEVLTDVEFSFPEIFAEFGETLLGDALRRRLQADRTGTETPVEESVDTKKEP